MRGREETIYDVCVIGTVWVCVKAVLVCGGTVVLNYGTIICHLFDISMIILGIVMMSS